MDDLDKKTVDALTSAIKDLTKTLTAGSSRTGGKGGASTDFDKNDLAKTAKSFKQQLSEYAQHLKDLKKKSEKLAQKELKDRADSLDNQRRIEKDIQITWRKMSAAADAMSQSFQQTSNTIKSLRDQMNNTLLRSAKSYHQAAYASQLLSKSLNSSASSAVKNIRAASMLHAWQIDQSQEIKNGESALQYRLEVESALNTAIKNGAAELARNLGLLNEITGELRSDLSIDELKNFRLALGEIDVAIAEAAQTVDKLREAGKTDLESIVTSMLEGDRGSGAPGELDEVSQATRALAKLAIDLESRGLIDNFIEVIGKESPAAVEAFTEVINDKRVLLSVDKLTNALAANTSNSLVFAKSLVQLNDTLSKTKQRLDATTTVYTSAVGQMAMTVKNGDQVIKKYLRELSSMASITALTNKALNHLKRTYQEIVDFNISNVAAGFKDVSFMSWQLGMTFGDTVKFMQENGRLLSQLGPRGFAAGMNQLKETFQNFGYNMQQAGELVGPAIEQSIYAGINTQNLSDLNKYINDTMTSFNKVSTIAGVTAKEYMQLNSQLLSSQGAFENLMGMDKERRKAYSDEIIARRDMYIQQGLTIQQAQELVKLQLEATRAPVRERAKNAAMALVRAQMAGLSPDQAMEAFRLSTKGVLTKEEQDRLQAIRQQTAVGLEQRRMEEAGRTGGFTWFIDQFTEGTALSGAAAQAEKMGLQQQAVTDAAKGLTDEQLKMAAALGKGNQAVSSFSQIINQVTSILGTSWIAALVTGAGAVAGLVVSAGTSISALLGLGKSATMASVALDKIASKGLVSGDIPGGPGAGKAGGKVLGALGRLAPYAATSLLGASALFEASNIEDLKKRGELTENQATVRQLGNLGMLAGGGAAAAIGAGLGSVLLPGVGTLLGAGLGGLVGGWLGKTGTAGIAGAFLTPDFSGPASAARAVNKQIDALIQSGMTSTKSSEVALRQLGLSAPEGAGGPQTVNMSADKGISINLPDMLKVTDVGANEKLSTIITQMSSAVEYLKNVSDAVSRESVGSLTNRFSSPLAQARIPTTNSYLTGRA